MALCLLTATGCMSWPQGEARVLEIWEAGQPAPAHQFGLMKGTSVTTYAQIVLFDDNTYVARQTTISGKLGPPRTREQQGKWYYGPEKLPMLGSTNATPVQIDKAFHARGESPRRVYAVPDAEPAGGG